MNKAVFLSVIMTVLSSVFVACKEKQAINAELLIPRDTMVEMLAEEHLFQSFAKLRSDRNLGGFEMTDAYRSMLEKHQVSDTAFRYSVDHYASDPAQFEAIYDEVIIRLSEMQAEF